MACFATPYGLRYAGHCFNRAHAQQNRPALIPAGGMLGVTSKVAKSAQKERDKLAHWVWGTSTNLPDALLLSDPRNLQFNNDLIFVYTADDFESMRRKFERIAGFGFEFRWILMGHPANRDGELYAKLCREPEIAEILRRQAQQD